VIFTCGECFIYLRTSIGHTQVLRKLSNALQLRIPMDPARVIARHAGEFPIYAGE